jgi:asparagine synthase (glutamine-hydrolysing)
MCGIAGWVDYKADLRDERETAAAMTATMALRGPDAEGLWVSPNAALGHRRLAVIDLEGGVQPMVAEEVVLTYSGEVYNFVELREELIALGHSFRTESDTEVVLHAYLEWGADCVERLVGMFAFAIWDNRSEELLLVRDRIGVKPLYYYPLPNGLLFGSEPKAILANPLARRSVAPVGICSTLTQIRRPGMTPFEGMLELRPGHLARCSRSGIDVRAYWQLEARPHEDDVATTVERVRAMLEEIMAQQLVADVPVCTLLSGGLDSSALAALGQEIVGGGLRTFTVDFTTNPENLAPNSLALHNTVDNPFALEVAAHLNSVQETLMLDTDALLEPEARRTALRAMDLPYHGGDADISLYLLFEEIRKHSTVAISGEAADEVFGGYPWMHDEAVLAVPFFPWMAAVMQQEEDAGAAVDMALNDRIGVLDFLFAQYGESLAEVPHLQGEEGKERRMRQVMHQHLTRLMPVLLDRKDRMSMATGLEVRVPFCDHRLVEYVFNTPWSMKTFDGREKSLLREASRDLVPESILERRKSGFPMSQDLRYDRNLQAAVMQILDSSDEPGKAFLGESIRPYIEEEITEITVSRRGRLEGAVRLNMWLKEYEVEIVGLD